MIFHIKPDSQDKGEDDFKLKHSSAQEELGVQLILGAQVAG